MKKNKYKKLPQIVQDVFNTLVMPEVNDMKHNVLQIRIKQGAYGKISDENCNLIDQLFKRMQVLEAKVYGKSRKQQVSLR